MVRSVSVLGLSLPIEPQRRDEPRHRCDAQGRICGVLAPGSSEWLLFEHGAPGGLRIRAESGHVYLDGPRRDNGVVEEVVADAAGRPARVVASGPGGAPVLDLEIAYD